MDQKLRDLRTLKQHYYPEVNSLLLFDMWGWLFGIGNPGRHESGLSQTSNKRFSQELGCWSWWPNHLPRNDPMDSIQVGKAVFVKEKLHNPVN